MNGKQARKLRKLIQEETVGMSPVGYVDTNQHTRWVPTGALSFDGTPKMVSVELYTRTLGPCQRKLYQRAKKLHHMFHGR